MRRLLSTCAVALALGGQVFAQATPFDMSPERQSGAETAAPHPTQGLPLFPEGGTVAEPPTGQEPGASPSDGAPPVASLAPGVPASDAEQNRYLIPFEKLVFPGEISERTWSVYLTPEQAASAASFNLGYQNAIIVAPETSRLRVVVNGATLADLPIQSPSGVAEKSIPVPAGLLKAGFNQFTFGATQRHRTDCGIPSTYELWTEVDQSRTFLSFADPKAGSLRRLDDIRAIGVGPTARTTIRIVAPAADQRTITAPLIRLSEGLAILANMPNQSISIAREVAPDRVPGEMTVVVGTASELQDVLAVVPAGGKVAPVAIFTDDARTGPSTLVITGPSWESLPAAIESVVSPTDRPVKVSRAALSTRTWRSPDTPLFTSGGRMKFSELGGRTQEFSGQRFNTDFAVGITSDFYAESYGQATILLDAAYSEEVLPGSHIDIYVNGNIAATVPVTAPGGEILRHQPIHFTLRHFRPGANIVGIEAVLLTKADAICAPGAAGNDAARFAIFDTSEFVMPQFARVGQRPNLAGLAGTGFPYGRQENPIPLVIENSQSDTLSAAATFMARISTAAGRPVPVDLTATVETVGNRDALFFGQASQLSSSALSTLKIAEAVRTEWGTAGASGVDTAANTDAVFTEWRDRLSGRGWQGQISVLEDWLTRKFDISFDAIRLTPRADSIFMPPPDSTLLVGQSGGPDDKGTWTLVTATTPQELELGVRALTEQANWDQLGGRITMFSGGSGKIDQVPISRFTFVPTQPASFTNYRLILANWLSANILAYSVLLAIACAVLGLVTAGMLQALGRHR